jgi:hypothetical protein
MPVVTGTWEGEIEGSQLEASSDKKKLAITYLKK